MRQAATGLYARLAGGASLEERDAGAAVRAQLHQLLQPGDVQGAIARLVPDWPSEALDEPAEKYFPLISWLVPIWSYIHGTALEGDVEIDVWAWPAGARGDGADLLDAVERCIIALFDGAVWFYDGARLQADLEPVRNAPADGLDEPHSRTYKLSLLCQEA